MQDIKQLVAEEQPAINREMARIIAELPPLSRPVAEHVFSAGGKRLRPVLSVLCGRLFGCRDRHLYTVGCAIELLHGATLLHDDIMDNADLRRGKPAAHTVFDQTRVILAGDAMLAKALLCVSSLGSVAMTSSLSTAVMKTAEGQIAELAALRNIALSHQEYIRIIEGKTAWLLRTSCELGALVAGATENQAASVAAFGLEIGIAFQLIDDALDFSSTEKTGKPCGGDLLEGKITPPIQLYVAALTGHEREQFIEKFSTGAFSPDDVATVSKAIQQQGFIESTRELAQKHVCSAKNHLGELPANQTREALCELADYIVSRSL